MTVAADKTLLTGAGGFIGSHLTEALVKKGDSVRVFIRYNSRNDWGLLSDLAPEVLDEIEIIQGDIKDPEAVRRAVRGRNVIYHLAALIAIPFSYTNPRDFVDTNVVGTANVLNAALEYGIDRLVQTSTSEVYGTARYTPIDEDHPLQGQSPYSASKIGADKLAESYHLAFDLPACILRPFNTYGPRQSARAVIPTIITQALSRESVFLGSLFPTRDLTFVTDTAAGFIQTRLSDLSVGQVINIGSGAKISIGDLAKKIIELLGRDVKIVEDSGRIRPEKSEVGELIAQTAKAAELISWQPKVTLDEGLRRTIDWMEKNLDRYKPELYNI